MRKLLCTFYSLIFLLENYTAVPERDIRYFQVPLYSHWHLITITDNSGDFKQSKQLSGLCLCLQEHPAVCEAADMANAGFPSSCDTVLLCKHPSHFAYSSYTHNTTFFHKYFNRVSFSLEAHAAQKLLFYFHVLFFLVFISLLQWWCDQRCRYFLRFPLSMKYFSFKLKNVLAVSQVTSQTRLV